jgi:hypothetical protein
MYNNVEIFNIIFECSTATELLQAKSILDEIQTVPFLLQMAYDFKMNQLLKLNII